MLKQVLKIGLGLSLVASSLLAAPEKTKLKIGFIALTDCAPLVVAKEKGFFEELGLDVEIKPFEFGIDIPKNVNDGKIDFAVGRETLILERIKNPNIVALYALFQSTPHIN